MQAKNIWPKRYKARSIWWRNWHGRESNIHLFFVAVLRKCVSFNSLVSCVDWDYRFRSGMIEKMWEASPVPCLTNQGMIHIIESCESSLVSCAFLTACSYYTWRQCSWMLRRWFARGSKAWRQCSCDHEQYSSRSPAAHTGLAREGARQQLQRQLEKQPWKLGILYEIQLIIIAS